MAALPAINLTATGLEIDGESLAFDEIVTVGYVKKVMRASGVITDVIRRFEVRAQDGRRLAVKLDGAKVLREEKNEAWGKLVAASQEAIEPRLRNQALEQIQRYGESVAIGRLELSRAGFVWRTPLRAKQYAWSDYHRAFYANCRIHVLSTPKGKKDQKVGEIDTQAANAVLLPQLMPACAEAFA
ncbi:MAG: hypothetical protein ACYDHH_33625 [Solirubrobacteraceae bacterium]